MDQVWIKEETLMAIGDAVRAKTGASGLLAPDAMLEALGNIKSSGKYLFEQKHVLTLEFIEYSTGIHKYQIISNDPNCNVTTLTSDIFYSRTIIFDSGITINIDSAGGFEVSGEPGAAESISVSNGQLSLLTSHNTSIDTTGHVLLDNVISYAISDDLAEYPDGNWQDGYYWECVGGAIEFTVSRAGVTTTYQAEGGMTWGEWVESKYNTNGYVMATISGVSTITDSTGYVLSESSLIGSSYYVLNTDKIVSGHTYYLSYVD